MLAYRKDIDGLRAIAVLSVIFFHAGFKKFEGGFVGVDVFFVITGFLITSIIAKEVKENTFSWLTFYERRARRILPALFLMIFLSIPFAWLLMIPTELKPLMQSLIAIPLFLSNFFFWQAGGYFGGPVEYKPFIHTWSLAIEEQYYFIFPFLFIGLWRFGVKMLVLGLLLITLSSLTYTIIEAARGKSESIFFLLTARAWEILMGALAAVVVLHKLIPAYFANDRIRNFLSIAGIILILGSILGFEKGTPFPSAYTIIPVLGTLLILVFTVRDGVLYKGLGNKYFVAVGLISYSAYLWHQPVFVFARIYQTGEPSKIIYLMLTCLTLLLAFLSYKFVERPFRDKSKVSKKTILIFSLAGSLIILIIGILGNYTDGFSTLYKKRLNAEDRKIYTLIESYTEGDQYKDMPDNGRCIFWQKELNDVFASRFQDCAKKFGKATIVVGDSHAMNIYGALARNNASEFLVSISQGYCRIHEEYPFCKYGDFLKFVKKNKNNIGLIIYHQSGRYFLKDQSQKENLPDFTTIGHMPLFPLYEENVVKVSDYLDALGAYTKVVWLGPRQEPFIKFNNFKEAKKNNFRTSPNIAENFIRMDQVLTTRFSKHTDKFYYVSLIETLKFEKETELFMGDCITFRDGDHFSVCGETIFGGRIRPELEKFISKKD